MGVRSRTRVCMGGVPGRGGCNGSSYMTQSCATDACRAICPDGFIPDPKGILLYLYEVYNEQIFSPLTY